MRVIIIGGVAAGMSAASKMKRLSPETDVVVYEKGEYLSYGACGLPYYVSGVNDDYNRMIIRTQDDFTKMGIKTHLQHEVVKVDPKRKQIMVRDLVKGRIFVDKYDKLMIATGASPIVPPIEGSDLQGVMSLKTLKDGILMKEILSQPEINRVTIIGAGYIGIEVAEAMVELGKEVRIIELGSRILTPFDEEMSTYALAELENHGVKIHLKEKVVRLEGTESVKEVITDQGRYNTDFVVMAIGVRPNTSFMKDTGIHMARNGALLIDREMRTNLEDIYAAGDCALVYHAGKEENMYIPLGTTANKCGRIAGINILGKHHKFVGTLGSAAIKVLDLELARTGLSEAEADALSIDYSTKLVTTYNKPPYYKDQQTIVFKMIVEKRTRRILGVQAVGKEGVVLRIDMFAIAIHNNMTTDEMGMTDLCYAPPFAGVWDAVHIASNAVK